MTTNIWANCSSLLYTFFSSNSLYIFIIHFLCQICQNTPNWIFTPRQRDTLSFSYPYPGAPYGRCISPKDQTYNLSCKKIILFVLCGSNPVSFCPLWFYLAEPGSTVCLALRPGLWEPRLCASDDPWGGKCTCDSDTRYSASQVCNIWIASWQGRRQMKEGWSYFGSDNGRHQIQAYPTRLSWT